MYKKYKLSEEENKAWKKTEFIKDTDHETLEDGTHAHNCNICKQTCRTCTKKMCKIIPPSPINTGMMGGSVAALTALPIAEAITASTAGIFAGITVAASVIPIIGAGIALGSGLAVAGVTKGVTMIRGNMKCDDCTHANSHHVTDQIKKTIIDKEIETIDEDMRKRFEVCI